MPDRTEREGVDSPQVTFEAELTAYKLKAEGERVLSVALLSERRRVLGAYERWGRPTSLTRDQKKELRTSARCESDLLSKEEQGRLRLRHVIDTFVHLWGNRVGRSVSAMAMILDDEAWIWMRMVLITPIAVEEELFTYLKGFEDIAISNGESTPIGAVFGLVGMGNFKGYVPVPEDRALFEEEGVRDWVDVQPHRYSEEYAERYRAGVREYLRRLCTAEKTNWVTIEEWLLDPSRLTLGGSSDMRNMPSFNWLVRTKKRKGGVTRVGLKARPEKTKGGAMLVRSLEEVRSKMWNWLKQVCRVIIKREGAKSRLVVGVDDITNLRMAYWAEWLESLMGQSNVTSVNWNSQTALEFDIRRQRQMFTTQDYSMPLDQTTFDHNTENWMWKIHFEEITVLLREKMGSGVVRDELEAMLQRTAFAIDGGVVKTTNGSTIPIKKGTLSGWRITTMFNSMSNYAQIRAAYHKIGVLPQIDDIIVEGDDSDIMTRNKATAEALIEAIQDDGAKVNPKKFFIARGRRLFLRRYGWSDGISGYPCRSALSLFWSNPINRGEVPFSESTRSRVELWRIITSRAHTRAEKVRELSEFDMSGLLNRGRSIVSNWLDTPQSLGGAGLTVGVDTPLVKMTVEKDSENVFAPNSGQWGSVVLAAQIQLPPMLPRKTVPELIGNYVHPRGYLPPIGRVRLTSRKKPVAYNRWIKSDSVISKFSIFSRIPKFFVGLLRQPHDKNLFSWQLEKHVALNSRIGALRQWCKFREPAFNWNRYSGEVLRDIVRGGGSSVSLPTAKASGHLISVVSKFAAARLDQKIIHLPDVNNNVYKDWMTMVSFEGVRLVSVVMYEYGWSVYAG